MRAMTLIRFHSGVMGGRVKGDGVRGGWREVELGEGGGRWS